MGAKKSALEKKTKKVNAAKEKKDKVEEPATADKEAAEEKAKEARGKVDNAQHALNLMLQGFKDLKQENYNYKKEGADEKFGKKVKELEEAADKDIEHVKKSALEKKTKKANA